MLSVYESASYRKEEIRWEATGNEMIVEVLNSKRIDLSFFLCVRDMEFWYRFDSIVLDRKFRLQ